MKLTFRWFGEGYDDVPLAYIRQIPCVESVVTMLMGVPAGEVWPVEDIERAHRLVTDAGLAMEVIESVNVHEDIKLGAPGRDGKLEAYIETMRRLAPAGVKVICYNFMPVLDWARSHLNHALPDGSETMYFDDEFIMNTTPEALAARYREQSGDQAVVGWEPERLAYVKDTIARYKGLTQEQYLKNARYFLDAVIPWAEKLDIKMAIHPDDPPWPIFGLPRLINNRENIRRFLELNPSPYNGLTLCTGSLGADPQNDVPELAAEFAPRIHFAHIRNLKYTGGRNFYESAHPTACGSLDLFAIVKALRGAGFDGYVRPDHGRMIWGEKGRAGYGLYDRALGAAYLAGLWEAVSRA
ncbi:MAG: mannonate dehydratase [Clostridiales bacterium]|jgi:mannonate dehydratase|nr:mannonate dehydratase [Clostridiales bacterium]